MLNFRQPVSFVFERLPAVVCDLPKFRSLIMLVIFQVVSTCPYF
jgi:hypothetical protein